MATEIEKMLLVENREKKRIGSNIFSRASTRKGGTNQALRTPYLYMSRKERKALNGEVKRYNMNDIISYKEFKTKDLQEKTRLMNHWRDNYKVIDIKKQMGGITDYIFYKILDELDMSRSASGGGDHREILELSSEEIEQYKKEFIDYEMFKHLSRETQYELFDAYYTNTPVVSELARQWEGAEAGYLYNVKSKWMKFIKEQKVEKDTKEDSKLEETLEIKKEKPVAKVDIDSSVEDKSPELFKFDLKPEPEELEAKIVEETAEEAVLLEEGAEESSEPIEEAPVEKVEEKEIKEGKEEQSSSNKNKLSFELKGNYSTGAIMKCLQFTLETLEQEESLTDIEVKVKKK
ncbi:hypothetical protein ACQKIY_25660 [Bacillus mycoides]|uniref:hypothetical protein n=1 Tax=Bacillus mycoides TaxID=1405 RepID=UPI003D013B4F